MRARVGAGLLLALAMGIASLPGAPSIQGEPTYHGKTAKQWAELLKDKDPKIRRRAVVHLGLAPFGKVAVPALVKALKDEDIEVVRAAVKSLGMLGRDAADAVPALSVLLKETDKDTSRDILKVLSRIGPASVPVLIEVLERGPENLHYFACSALRQIGPEAKEAVDSLIAVMKTAKDYAGREAAYALSSIGEPALPRLIEDIKGPNVSVLAIRAIREMGSKANGVVPLLVEALKDPNEEVSREAVWALCDLQELPTEAIGQLIQVCVVSKDEGFWRQKPLVFMGKKAVPALEEALNSPNHQVRAFALSVIHQIKPRSLDDLIQALQDNELRQVATSALNYYASDLKVTMPVMTEAFKDKDEKVRHCLVKAVGRFQPRNEVIAFLTEGLADSDPGVWKEAMDAISSMGPRAKNAVPALIKHLGENDVNARLEVLVTIAKVGSGEKQAMRALCQALKDSHAKVRRRAATLLGEQGERAKAAVIPLMIVFLRDTGTVRVEAALALWRVTKRECFVQALVQIMSDPNGHPAARVEAAQGLGSIGPSAKQAVPGLMEALQSPSYKLQDAALQTLANIGPDAKDVIPELGRLLQADKPKHENKIVEALENIGKPALPTLLKSLHAKDGSLRWHVCQAIINIDPETNVLLPHLIEALYADSYENRRGAAKALAFIGSSAKSAIPALAEILRDNGPNVQSEIIAALQALGPDPRSIRALKTALDYRGWYIRQDAADALGSFGPAAKPAAQALRQALKDPDPVVRASAAIALWRVEGDKKPALPILKELTRDKNAEAGVIAAKGLWEIDQDENGLHLLVATLQEGDRRIQGSAYRALKGFGPRVKVIAPKLIKLLESRSSYSRLLAGDALIEIDPKAAVQAGLTLPDEADDLTRSRKKKRLTSLVNWVIVHGGLNRIEDWSDEPTEDIDMKSGKVLPHPPPRVLKPEDLPVTASTPCISRC